jgi:hypothetical protein
MADLNPVFFCHGYNVFPNNYRPASIDALMQGALDCTSTKNRFYASTYIPYMEISVIVY